MCSGKDVVVMPLLSYHITSGCAIEKIVVAFTQRYTKEIEILLVALKIYSGGFCKDNLGYR